MDTTNQPNPASSSSITARTRPEAYDASIDGYITSERKRLGPDYKDIVMLDVLVPAPYALTIAGHVRVEVPPGYQTMPKEWAENWFSRANGVSVANQKSRPAADGKQADAKPAANGKK